jgi:hypothetical protein
MNNKPSIAQQPQAPRAGRKRKYARYDLPVLRGITRARAARSA